MKKPNIKKTSKENKFPTGRVKCVIFQSKNEDIEKINKAINEAENIEKKAYFAERLVKKVEEFLTCEHFDEEKPGCKICQFIAKLRKKTANLIIKAKQLKAD